MEWNGKHMYKLIMLKLMATICNRLSDCTDLGLNTIDTAIEMIAKVARRIEKIANFPDVTVSTHLTAEVNPFQRCDNLCRNSIKKCEARKTKIMVI